MSLKDPIVPRNGQEECAMALEGEELPVVGRSEKGQLQGVW